MNATKHPAKSKTIWGIAIMGLAMIAQHFGWEVGDLNGLIEAVGGLIGAALAVYGRLKAFHRIGG